MTPASQVPVETHAAIYGTALIVIFRLVGVLFPAIPKLIDGCIYQSFIVFLTGICVRDKNQSASGIAEHFGLKSHDALTKMLSHKCWSASLLMLQILNQALELALCSRMRSWLILDDVILSKNRSFRTDGVYWDWDYVNQKYVLCMRLVVLVWTNGIIRLPIAFACYHRENSEYLKKHQKKFRTKNQLARALVYQVTKKGLLFDYLTFDSWYASEENLVFFNRLQIRFITALQSNRKLRMSYYPLEHKPKRRSKNLRWYKFTCTEWAAQKPYVRDYRYYKKVDARARQTLVFLKDVDSLLKFVCIKNYARNKAFRKLLTASEKRAKDPNKYLITNNLTLTIPQVISYYRSRWTIEVVFRDCKQHLAFGKCQARKELEQHLRHTAIVFLAFALLESVKARRNLGYSVNRNPINQTIGDLKRELQNQQLIYVNGQYHIFDTSRTSWDWETVDFLVGHLELNNTPPGETQLVFNFKTEQPCFS